jgi:hypothetical protein
MLDAVHVDDYPRRAVARTFLHFPDWQQRQPSPIAALRIGQHPRTPHFSNQSPSVTGKWALLVLTEVQSIGLGVEQDQQPGDPVGRGQLVVGEQSSDQGEASVLGQRRGVVGGPAGQP